MCVCCIYILIVTSTAVDEGLLRIVFAEPVLWSMYRLSENTIISVIVGGIIIIIIIDIICTDIYALFPVIAALYMY